MRTCAKTRCDQPAGATMALRYGAREVLLADLIETHDRNLVDLCHHHAAAMRAPVGWVILDQRTRAPIPWLSSPVA
jgi:hypothetical protein